LLLLFCQNAINTSDKINMNYTQMRQRWTGARWDQFSEVLNAASE
jgi:hypothetical protein